VVNFDFQDKIVLVTGATSGIGQAIARAFSKAGANVIAAGLPAGGASPDPVREKMRTELLEVTNQQSVDRLVASLPKLDVLVNAAGIIRRDAEFTLEKFTEVIDVNLTGVMRMSMAAKPKLMASSGSVINIASMYSSFGAPRAPAYAASKGGIAQLTRSLAVAWAPDKIRVNAIAPGWVATPLTQALRDDETRSAPILARTPMGRWATPEDVAGPVLFLASDLAAFVTGAILPVDGGYSSC
jgi:NAD(P)-dependent dehydrogenase (short-subunit alcohol dehydrogenase family)